MNRPRAVLATLVASAACAPAELPVDGTGRLSNVEAYVDRLVRAPDYGILVIEADGQDRFINFSAVKGELQMDFPLITSVQRSREGAARRLCAERALRHEEVRGSDGSRFLDCWLPTEPAVAAAAVRAALVEVLTIDDSTALRFRASGLAPARLAP